MTIYATVSDLISLWGKTLTDSEQARAEALIKAASASLFTYAYKRGINLDELLSDETTGEVMTENAKNTVCNAVMRVMRGSTDGILASQATESANGYSISYTPANSSGDWYFTKTELAWLGLNSQRFGGLDLYGVT